MTRKPNANRPSELEDAKYSLIQRLRNEGFGPQVVKSGANDECDWSVIETLLPHATIQLEVDDDEVVKVRRWARMGDATKMLDETIDDWLSRIEQGRI